MLSEQAESSRTPPRKTASRLEKVPIDTELLTAYMKTNDKAGVRDAATATRRARLRGVGDPQLAHFLVRTGRHHRRHAGSVQPEVMCPIACSSPETVPIQSRRLLGEDGLIGFVVDHERRSASAAVEDSAFQGALVVLEVNDRAARWTSPRLGHSPV